MIYYQKTSDRPWTASQLMSDAYETLRNHPDYIAHSPFLIWFMENPDCPLHFPGELSLKDHDLLHIILDQPLSNDGEAYVIGYTMGADDRTRPWHCRLYKWISKYLYPLKYQFTDSQLKIFDHGFACGLKSKTRNLHKQNFFALLDVPINQARTTFMTGEMYYAQ